MGFSFFKSKQIESLDCCWVKTAVEAARVNDIEPELFVALILNESSGNQFATRWERRFFVRYIAERPIDTLVPHAGSLDQYEEQTLRLCLAHSWGLCQIMGVVAVEHGFRGRQLWELLDIETNVSLGARILSGYRDGILRTTKGLPPPEVLKRTLLRYNGGGDIQYPDRVLKRLPAAAELVKKCRG